MGGGLAQHLHSPWAVVPTHLVSYDSSSDLSLKLQTIVHSCLLDLSTWGFQTTSPEACVKWDSSPALP